MAIFVVIAITCLVLVCYNNKPQHYVAIMVLIVLNGTVPAFCTLFIIQLGTYFIKQCILDRVCISQFYFSRSIRVEEEFLQRMKKTWDVNLIWLSKWTQILWQLGSSLVSHVNIHNCYTSCVVLCWFLWVLYLTRTVAVFDYFIQPTAAKSNNNLHIK